MLYSQHQGQLLPHNRCLIKGSYKGYYSEGRVLVLGLGHEPTLFTEIESDALCHPDGCGRQMSEWRRPRKAGELVSLRGGGGVR